MTETPRQFSARHLRIAIERAKVAVIEAQEEALNLRGNPTSIMEVLAASFTRLDSAWAAAWEIEKAERAKTERRAA